MADYAQISAYISDAARARLDQYARETGLKKGRIVEDAIQAYLDARTEVPAEYIVPTRLVLTDESFDEVARAIEEPADPTAELIELLRPHRGEFRKILGLDDD